jgi:transcriptional regulator with XRE-family HTH domain
LLLTKLRWWPYCPNPYTAPPRSQESVSRGSQAHDGLAAQAHHSPATDDNLDRNGSPHVTAAATRPAAGSVSRIRRDEVLETSAALAKRDGMNDSVFALPFRARRPFGVVLKECRSLSGISQLSLSLEAGVSSRHVSFLEGGRARPSEAMIERLSAAMSLPESVVNVLLDSAGYAQKPPDVATRPSPLPYDFGEVAFATAVALEDVRDADALVAGSREVLASVGLPYFFFASVQPSRNGRYDIRIDHPGSFPDSWLRRYLDRHYATVDPLLTAAEEGRSGFFWADVVKTDGLCRTAVELFHNASKEGLDSGFVNAIRRADGTLSIVSMMGGGLNHNDSRLRVALRTVGTGMLERMTRLRGA